MPQSIQNGINQSFRNTSAQQQMLRNQMDTQRASRDQLNRDRLNQESERRIRDQITSLQRSLDAMNQARGREQTRRQVQDQLDRAQSQLRRLEEERAAGGLNPGAGDFDERGPQAPARRQRARRGRAAPMPGQVRPAGGVDAVALADRRLRMAQGIEQAGNLQGALASFQQVVDEQPGTPQAVLAGQKIAELKQRIKYRRLLGLE